MSFSMPSEVRYGSVQVSTRTPLGKELWQHEKRPDYDPDKHRYPKMMYRAYQMEDGKIRFIEGHPKPFLFINSEQFRMACEEIDNFNNSCMLTVGAAGEENLQASQAEHRRAKDDGWQDSPSEATQHILNLHRDIVKAATERAGRDQNMSPAAHAEIQAAEDATPDVIADIPQKRTVKIHWKTAQKAARLAAKETV